MERWWRVMGGAMLVLALAGVACGGEASGEGVASLGGSEESPSASTERRDPQAAFLEFAECMREQGVKVETGGDGRGISIDFGEADPDEVRDAEEACRHLLDDIEPPEGVEQIPPEERQRQLERLLRFARCMREHGIDFPDPQTDDGFLRIGPDESVDPRDPDFRDAQEACRSLLPEGPGERRALGR